jgi:trehalose 6-phosphate phosphatase
LTSTLFEPASPVRRRLQGLLARRPSGLLTDVDGTISAIAPAPDQAELLPGIRDILVAACAAFDLVAAVSGRAALDAKRMVGVPEMLYIGNHGMEYLEPQAVEGRVERATILPAAQPYVPLVDAALDAIEREVAPRFSGLIVEHKGATGSVHYRLVRDPEAAEETVLDTLTRHGFDRTLRLTRGKQVVELRPPIDVDKGTAIVDVTHRHHLSSAICLGDDRTDLDAFHALSALAAQGDFIGFSVAVLHPEGPPELADSADLPLASIDLVPGFLRWLVSAAGQRSP